METDAQKISIKDIRIKYPTPTTVGGAGGWSNTSEYCVGGAFILATNPKAWEEDPFSIGGYKYRFPSYEKVSDAIHLTATGKPRTWCTFCNVWSRKVVRANDSGNFDSAWSRLAEAIQTHP